MDQATLDLNHKIDLLTEQVAYLAEQARAAEQARQSVAELVEIGVPIARDVMRIASDEMEDVQEYLELADLVRLLKKLIRLAPLMEPLLDQASGAADLLQIGGTVLREGMDKATSLMDDMDRKGYFSLAEGGVRMVDNIATSFTRQDVDKLADNVVLILNTVKDMTQPEIMNFVRGTLLVAEKEVEKPVDISYPALLRQMQDPAVRRGLALTMRVLKVVGQQAEPNGNGNK
jgi:uncharacterized protein YjgD (DUF1641 family)